MVLPKLTLDPSLHSSLEEAQGSHLQEAGSTAPASFEVPANSSQRAVNRASKAVKPEVPVSWLPGAAPAVTPGLPRPEADGKVLSPRVIHLPHHDPPGQRLLPPRVAITNPFTDHRWPQVGNKLVS